MKTISFHHIDFATNAPGGVPDEAAPNDVAIDAVKVSFERATDAIASLETPPSPEPADPPIEKNDYQLVVGISVELG